VILVGIALCASALPSVPAVSVAVAATTWGYCCRQRCSLCAWKRGNKAAWVHGSSRWNTHMHWVKLCHIRGTSKQWYGYALGARRAINNHSDLPKQKLCSLKIAVT
jgi:hypothetical protein